MGWEEGGGGGGGLGWPLKADLGCARLEEPVKPEAPVIPNCSLQLVPLAVAQQVHLAQNEAILFFCVGLALVGAVLQLQLLQECKNVVSNPLFCFYGLGFGECQILFIFTLLQIENAYIHIYLFLQIAMIAIDRPSSGQDSNKESDLHHLCFPSCCH